MLSALFPTLPTGSLAVGRLACVACSLMLMTAAQGQTSAPPFRVVGPDGRVTYTDRPPGYDASVARAAGAGSAASADALAVLPYALRMAVQRYPVLLYTAPACAPCEAGRALLQRRGVPVQELRVATGEDGAALQAETGARDLPVLMVGRQRSVGFAEGEWLTLLDAAGYPASPVLPSGWREAPARSLAEVRTERSATGSKPPAPAPRASAAPPLLPASAGRFQF